MRRLPILLASCAVAACTASSGEPVSARSSLSAPEWSRVVPWGAADGQVGLSPAGPEHLAEGPSSIAVDPAGAVWILDRLNRRLVRVSADPAVAPRPAAAADRDAEDLALGLDGVMALYSPLRSRVVVQDGAQRRTEIAVPRALEDVVGVALGRSRQVSVFTAEQEHFRLGSPGVPQILSAVLHSKREGAARLEDGSRVQSLRHPDGSVELLHLGADGQVQRLALPGPALSARVVGAAHGMACARIERASPVPDVVERRAVCLDLASGATALDVELGPPGLYVPRRELALGGGATPSLVFILPEEGGLRVTARSLATVSGGAR